MRKNCEENLPATGKKPEGSRLLKPVYHISGRSGSEGRGSRTQCPLLIVVSVLDEKVYMARRSNTTVELNNVGDNAMVEEPE